MAATILGGFYLRPWPVLLMAIASALVWNFFYVPPQFTFNIHSGQDVLLFFLLLLIAVSMGQLTARLRALNQAERRRETRSFALYRFLDCLNQESDPVKTVAEALSHAREVTGSQLELFLNGTTIAGASVFPEGASLNAKEAGVMDWVVKNRELAGQGTQNLPEIDSLFIPVEAGEQVIGVLRVRLKEETLPLASRDLLMQMGRLLGRFLEREVMRSKLEEVRVIKASQRLQKTLLDTVSHELKTPLTIILGSLEQVLSKASENSGEQQLLFHAQQSSKRLLRNVNMLLDLTRFDAGVIKPKTERVDWDDLVHRLHHELTDEYGDRAARICMKTDGGTVQSDEALLFQLLNQLLRNSMEHTPPETEVHCKITCESEWCRLQVWDTGPGLPGNVEALFEPFSHGSHRRSKGLGLGLSITKRICEILGGTLEARNTEQGGACFTATIPAQAIGLQSP
jgi:two-component system sensor histidine kinase KdpD